MSNLSSKTTLHINRFLLCDTEYLRYRCFLIKLGFSCILSLMSVSIVCSQSIDWVIEPIITDAEKIDLNLAMQDEINLVSVRSAGKWGMKNARNEVLAPTEFDAAQVWKSGKYFDMRLGRVQRFFDAEGYEVDFAEVDAYQKTVNERDKKLKLEKSILTLSEKHDWLEFREMPTKYGPKIIAINKESRDTVCDRVSMKSLFITSEKFSLQQHKDRMVLKDKDGKVVKTYEKGMSVSKFRADRFIVRKDNLNGILGEKGQVILPIEYKRINFLSDDYLYIKKADKEYEIIDRDGNTIPGAKGENIFPIDIENMVAIEKSKYEMSLFNMVTKEMKSYPYNTRWKKYGNGIYQVQNESKFKGLYDFQNDKEIVPCKYRSASKSGAYLVASMEETPKRKRGVKRKPMYKYIIDMSGAVLLEDSIFNVTNIQNKILIVSNKKGSYKIYDPEGNMIQELPDNVLISQSKNPNYFAIAKKGEKYNYLTVEDYLAGNTKNGYDSVGSFKNNSSKQLFCAVVGKNGKKGVINNRGEIIIPIELDEFDLTGGYSRILPAKVDGKWGAIKNPLYEEK